MNRGSLLLTIGLTVLSLACDGVPEAPTHPTAPVRTLTISAAAEVTNAHDSGPGSLRAAVERANAEPDVALVRFAPGIGTIELERAVIYSGGQQLRIVGRGATVTGIATCDCDLLVATGGAELSLWSLEFRNGRRSGVVVDIPASATDDVGIELRDVTLAGNGLHGLHVDDQRSDASDPTGADSDASILVVIASSLIEGNGFREGFSDFDGVRVDEGGAGDLVATVRGSRFVNNAGDGLELDERGAGSVSGDVAGSDFIGNGAQPQNTADLEDGFDIDEADEGNIQARIVDAEASGNFDEGFDLGEEGLGEIRLVATRVEAVGNLDQGIKLSEDVETLAGGGIYARLAQVTASRSQKDDGVLLEEAGPGDLRARLTRSELGENAGSGIHVEQADSGRGWLWLYTVTIEANGEVSINANGVTVFQSP